MINLLARTSPVHAPQKRRPGLRGRDLPGDRLSFARILGRPGREMRRRPNHLPLRVSAAVSPRLAAWLGSFLLHACFFFLIVTVLIRHARFDVQPGKTSTEIELMEQKPPALPAAVAQPATQPPPQPVSPPVPVAPALPLLKPAAPTEKTPAIVSAPPAKPHSAKIIAKGALHPARAALAKGAVLAQPDELHNPPPVYPEESRAAREQGIVMLRVDVSGAGRAGKVVVVKSSGYFRLDQSARKAVLAWRFQPASIGGATIDSEVDVPIRFQLE
jgi:protein TonB